MSAFKNKIKEIFSIFDTHEETMDEFEDISEMILEAEKQSLLIEVIWSYGQEKESGKSTKQACINALCEWDII